MGDGSSCIWISLCRWAESGETDGVYRLFAWALPPLLLLRAGVTSHQGPRLEWGLSQLIWALKMLLQTDQPPATALVVERGLGLPTRSLLDFFSCLWLKKVGILCFLVCMLAILDCRTLWCVVWEIRAIKGNSKNSPDCLSWSSEFPDFYLIAPRILLSLAFEMFPGYSVVFIGEEQGKGNLCHLVIFP